MVTTVARRPGPWLRATAALGALLLLSACSMTSSSDLLDPDAGGCTGSAGGYYLAKSYLQVIVEKDAKTGWPHLKSVNVLPKADRSAGYCLSFLASSTSRDTFVVQKDKEHNLLMKITSSAEDRSTQVVNTLVQTVFKALEAQAAFAANRSSGQGPPELVNAFNAEFDPFNEAQTDIVNDGLKDFGYCLLLDRGDGGVWATNPRYCDDPLGSRGTRRLAEATEIANRGSRIAGRFQAANGVLYRPRLPYTLYLMTNRNRDGRRVPWHIWQSAPVYLENRSPILSVAVDRTYFATRKTTLLFDMGALQDVYVEKESEVANAAEIPLNIAKGVAALPSRLIQVRFDVTNRREQLIKAQDELIEAERKLDTARKLRRAAELSRAAPEKPSNAAAGGEGVQLIPDVADAAGAIDPNRSGATGPSRAVTAAQCTPQSLDRCMALGRSQSMCHAIGCR
jgi:hypothetical protein